jgi:hypothetical protein
MLRAFLCHSRLDKPAVRHLYRELSGEGVSPWFDEEDLVPGEDWELTIRKAVHASDVVLVCISRASVTTRGFAQKEIKLALDEADEQPEGTIFIIPVRLDECEVPDRLHRWHWVNLFEANGLGKLMNALEQRAIELGIELGRRDRHIGEKVTLTYAGKERLEVGRWVTGVEEIQPVFEETQPTLKDVVLVAPLLRDGAYATVLHGLNPYGAITCTFTELNLTASTQLFQNGEIWCVSAALIRTERDRVPQYVQLPCLSAFVLEQTYYDTLRRLIEFATTKLDLKPPWDVELGLAGVKGLYFNWESNPLSNQVGPLHKTEIAHRCPLGDSKAQTLDEILLSFFSKVFDSVGERRPTHLYGFPPNRPTLANR